VVKLRKPIDLFRTLHSIARLFDRLLTLLNAWKHLKVAKGLLVPKTELPSAPMPPRFMIVLCFRVVFGLERSVFSISLV